VFTDHVWLLLPQGRGSRAPMAAPALDVRGPRSTFKILTIFYHNSLP